MHSVHQPGKPRWQGVIARLWQGSLDRVADSLWPPVCALCEEALPAVQSHRGLCFGCWQACVHSSVRCPRCAGVSARAVQSGAACSSCTTLVPGVPQVIVAGSYQGRLRRLIHRLKFRAQTPCVRPLAALLAYRLGRHTLPADAVIAAVPMSGQRRRERGLDHAALVGRQVARSIGLPWLKHGLERTVHSPALFGLCRRDRIAALRGVMRASEKHVRGRSIVLVDDVLTTGATLAACTQALLAAGAREVIGACVARREWVEPVVQPAFVLPELEEAYV